MQTERLNAHEPEQTRTMNAHKRAQTRTNAHSERAQTRTMNAHKPEQTMEKPLIGGGNNDQLMLHPGSQIFGNGAQNALYQNKVQELATAIGRMEGLEKMVTTLQENNLDLTNSLRDQKNEYELKILKLIADHKEEIRELQDEIKDLNRELQEAQKDTGLNGIWNKTLEKEDGIQQLFGGLSGMISSVAELKNGLSEDQRALLNFYKGLTPEYRKDFDNFIIALFHAGLNGKDMLNQFLQNYGTITTHGDGQQPTPGTNTAAQ